MLFTQSSADNGFTEFYILTENCMVGPPKIQLGTEIKKYQVRGGKYYWSMLSTWYMKNEIKTV